MQTVTLNIKVPETLNKWIRDYAQSERDLGGELSSKEKIIVKALEQFRAGKETR